MYIKYTNINPLSFIASFNKRSYRTSCSMGGMLLSRGRSSNGINDKF